MTGYDVVVADGLLCECYQRIAAGRARVQRWVVRRFAMSETIYGEHVIALRQLGQHGRVIFPFHSLPMHEQKRRPAVGTFCIVDRGTINLRLFFGKACSERAINRAFVAM